MTHPNVVWFVASRGADRHKDYRWVAQRGESAIQPSGSNSRREQLEVDTQEYLTGDNRPNAFLRQTQDGWELALWQIRNSLWPTDAENRPIMAHVMGIGSGSAPARRKLENLARAGLTTQPPQSLIQSAANARGFEVDFGAISAWWKAVEESDRARGGVPSLGELASLLGGTYAPTAGAGRFTLRIPTPPGGGAGDPKAPSGATRASHVSGGLVVSGMLLLVVVLVVLIAL